MDKKARNPLADWLAGAIIYRFHSPFKWIESGGLFRRWLFNMSAEIYYLPELHTFIQGQGLMMMGMDMFAVEQVCPESEFEEYDLHDAYNVVFVDGEINKIVRPGIFKPADRNFNKKTD